MEKQYYIDGDVYVYKDERLINGKHFGDNFINDLVVYEKKTGPISDEFKVILTRWFSYGIFAYNCLDMALSEIENFREYDPEIFDLIIRKIAMVKLPRKEYLSLFTPEMNIEKVKNILQVIQDKKNLSEINQKKRNAISSVEKMILIDVVDEINRNIQDGTPFTGEELIGKLFQNYEKDYCSESEIIENMAKEIIKQRKIEKLNNLLNNRKSIILNVSNMEREEKLKHKGYNAKELDEFRKKIKMVSKQEADELGKKLLNIVSCKKHDEDTHLEEVEELILKGANLEVVDEEYGDTSLIKTAKSQKAKYKTFKLLIKAGANINAQSQLTNKKAESNMGFGSTTTMWAAKRGYIDILEDLILLKADINKTDSDNDTALMIAFNNNKDESVKILIDNGAMLDVRDYNNMVKSSDIVKQDKQKKKIL